jgi:hypothetical protein
MAAALTVKDWAERARGLSREDFARKHAHPFLLQELAASDDEPDKEYLQFSTVEIGSAPAKAKALLTADSLSNLQVMQVVKRLTGAFQGMIFVGRAENNDVVQDDSSVSKFHAFFTKDPTDDVYLLTDAGSMNGTFVNDQRLKPHESTRLAPGDVISFGRLRAFRFHHPETFHQLLSLTAR